MDYIQQDGRIFISSTILNNKLTLRAAILSFRTHKEEIDLLLYLLKKNKNSPGCLNLFSLFSLLREECTIQLTTQAKELKIINITVANYNSSLTTTLFLK